jgi:FKBP-type peptidyl-prolyl cis-trans isomerase FklB
MKKISFFTMLAVAAGFTFTSCNKSGDVTLSNEKDSLSYAYGVGYGSHIANNILGEDSTGTKVNAFIKGLKEGLKSNDENVDLYAMGINVGASLSKDAKDGLMGDSALSMNIDIIKDAIFLAIEKKELKMNSDQANEFIQALVERKQEEKLVKEYGSNKEIGERFLAENKTKPGIITTASGLQYQIIKEGKGPKPTAESRVKVHYTGTLVDGTVFDSSYDRKEPVVFPVQGVIKGWSEALQLMPVGSKWKLFIPQDLAYGARSQNPIPPFSTLIFEVELLNIEK